jgi:hypothetical protein
VLNLTCTLLLIVPDVKDGSYLSLGWISVRQFVGYFVARLIPMEQTVTAVLPVETDQYREPHSAVEAAPFI